MVSYVAIRWFYSQYSLHEQFGYSSYFISIKYSSKSFVFWTWNSTYGGILLVYSLIHSDVSSVFLNMILNINSFEDFVLKNTLFTRRLVSNASIESIDTEIQKCQLLCCNCHKKRTIIQMKYHDLTDCNIKRETSTNICIDCSVTINRKAKRCHNISRRIVYLNYRKI